jgi:hypothetical protein
MIITALDMYTALQDGINKVMTSSIDYPEGERLLNKAMMEYIKNHYYSEEETEKRIDDLRTLREESIVSPSSMNMFPLPYSEADNPIGYLFMLTVAFKIHYVNNNCGFTGDSDWLSSKVLRSNFKNVIDKDPYNRPTDLRLYYEIVGNTAILQTGTQSYGIAARMEYLRYPKAISLTIPQDCELPVHARQEIVDIAVRKYLEQVTDPRYQTNLNEVKNVIT